VGRNHFANAGKTFESPGPSGLCSTAHATPRPGPHRPPPRPLPRPPPLPRRPRPPPSFSSSSFLPGFRFADMFTLPDSTSGGTSRGADERPLNHPPPPPPPFPPSPPSRAPLSPPPSPRSTSYACAMAARVALSMQSSPASSEPSALLASRPSPSLHPGLERSPCAESDRWVRWGEEAEDGETWGRVK
jgi:hypothetical protein